MEFNAYSQWANSIRRVSVKITIAAPTRFCIVNFFYTELLAQLLLFCANCVQDEVKLCYFSP